MIVEDKNNGEGNFWETKGYSVITRRTAAGHFLCDQFAKMIGELEAVFTTFSHGLEAWTKTWSDKIDHNEEVGASVTVSMRCLFQVANAYASAHAQVAKDLKTNIMEELKRWQKTNYHKNFFGRLKEAEEIDDGFAQSQEPWTRLNKKVDKAKTAYHCCSKRVFNARHLELMARNDTSKSADELGEMRQKVARLEVEEEDAKTCYKTSINALDNHRPKYKEHMQYYQTKADGIEKRRLEFFQSLLRKGFQAFNCLVLKPDIDIFMESLNGLDASIDAISIDEDIAYFRLNHGADMPLKMTSFDEYTARLHQISSGQKLSKKLGRNHKTLKALKIFRNGTRSTLPSPVVQKRNEKSESRVTMLHFNMNEEHCDVNNNSLAAEVINEAENEPKLSSIYLREELVDIHEAGLGSPSKLHVTREDLTPLKERAIPLADRYSPVIGSTNMKLDNPRFTLTKAEDEPKLSSIYLREESVDNQEASLGSLSEQHVTMDDLTPLKESEQTLAGGGSAIGGFVSSFDKDLSLPDRYSPVIVSTNIKLDNPRFTLTKVLTPGIAKANIFSFETIQSPTIKAAIETSPDCESESEPVCFEVAEPKGSGDVIEADVEYVSDQSVVAKEIV